MDDVKITFTPHSQPTPRTFEGKEYFGAADVAQICRVDRTTVLFWHKKGLFIADKRTHDGRYLYEIERVMQLKAVYHPDWMRGGYQPSPTTANPASMAPILKGADFMNHDEQIAQAEQTFNLVFGGVHEPKFSYVCTIDDKKFGKPYPFDVSTAANRRAMAEKAIELSDLGHNVYFGVNCSDEPPTGYQRGGDKNISLQTATICDIDIDGGNHKTGAKKKLAKDFDAAKSFLPFELSLLVHSGGGLHGYCLYSEPLNISDVNRDDAKHRNKNFIEAIRSKAGKTIQIDGVGDFARVLRVPGTKNYKGADGNDAPLCHIVEVNPTRFTADDLDAKLDGAFLASEAKILKPVIDKLSENYKKSARTRFENIFDSAEYNIFRAERMLDVLKSVNHNDLSYGRWLAIQTACKNIGVDYAVVDAFNQCEPSNYNAEQNLRRWQKLNAPSFGIETLHGIARDLAGYREADARQAYRKAYPDLFRKPNNSEARAEADDKNFFSDDDYKKYFSDDTTDLANALRLEFFCGDSIRWLKDDEQWLLYENGFWQRKSEKPTAILPFAKSLHEVLIQNAVDADAVKIANSFKKSGKVYSAFSFLRACDSIRISADDLDNHGELLNCLNGVIDLTNGNFYQHADKKTALITQKCRAAYYPDATSELIEKFFCDIQPDEMTRRGLLRWLGYSLTAECSEEKFIVAQGSGSNGKGVLGATILELLGDYATGLNQRALLRNVSAYDADKASTSLNCLANRRLALSEELPLKAELNIELIKNLTGGDRLPIRRLYHEEKTIRNFAKIIISGNYKPSLENVNDDGLKRRLLNIPFTQKFGVGGKPVDFNLKRKMILPQNLSALLTLLVREAVAWYNEYSKGNSGLIISDLMKLETSRHLDDNNFVAAFIDDGDKFIRVESASVKAKDFLDALKIAYPVECSKFKQKDLIQLIESVGGVKYAVGSQNKRVFKGIGLRGDDFDGEPIAPDDIPPPPPSTPVNATAEELDLPF